MENAEYLLHGKGDNIEYINGDFQDINLQTIEPAINEQQALLFALEFAGAEKYKWEDIDMENFIKQNQSNPNASYCPQGELVISKDYLKGSNLFKLSWKFIISSLQPNNEQMIFVDAMNGEIIRDDLLILKNVPGVAQTLYSGIQGIFCNPYNFGYTLSEIRNTTIGNSVTIETLKDEGLMIISGKPFYNSNTNWISGSWTTFDEEQAALDVHWGAEKVLDYFSSVHSRNGIGETTQITVKSYVSCVVGANGAFWYPYGSFMFYYGGDGVNCNPWTSIDIVAHEMGHGFSNVVPNSPELNLLSSDFQNVSFEVTVPPVFIVQIPLQKVLHSPVYYYPAVALLILWDRPKFQKM